MKPIKCLYCKYCNKCLEYVSTKFHTTTFIVREYRCPPCNVFFYWEMHPDTNEILDLAFEKLQTMIGEQLCEVSVYHRENFTCIDIQYTPVMRDFMAFHGGGLKKVDEVHIRLDCIMKVNPSNIADKLHKYLIFT